MPWETSPSWSLPSTSPLYKHANVVEFSLFLHEKHERQQFARLIQAHMRNVAVEVLGCEGFSVRFYIQLLCCSGVEGH
jgi:hypothetical protein